MRPGVIGGHRDELRLGERMMVMGLTLTGPLLPRRWRLNPAAQIDLPFVAGCSAWLACKVVPEPHNQQTYDLFIGEIVGAWSDTRVFKDGHWNFETADPALRSLHYIAGGHFYAIGDPLVVSDA